MLRGWNKQEWSWALYDWANSVYALIVITAFFPFFLKYHVNFADSGLNVTTLLGYANSLASLAVVILAPAMGAIADQFGAKKKLLGVFAAVGILATFSLSLVSNGQPMLAAFIFVLGNIGFSTANGLYDALILSMTSEDKLDRLSALGFSLGYAGSLILFVFGFLTSLHPELFGLSDSIAAMRLIFILTALWWLIFMIPLLAVVQKEERLAKEGIPPWQAVKSAFGELRETLQEIRQYRAAAIFLLAYWLYIDGVYTVIKMAVAYSEALGFESSVPLKGILLVQVIAIPATLGFGWMAGKFGARRMIMTGILAYLVVTVGAPFMTRPEHFYILAVIIGLAQGGIQSISRSMFARLIPQSEAGKYFGFYNMVGKFAAVLGPFLMATIAFVFNERFSILAIPVLLIMGMVLLAKVKDPGQGKVTI
jgi:UMF1 family MFS transporter